RAGRVIHLGMTRERRSVYEATAVIATRTTKKAQAKTGYSCSGKKCPSNMNPCPSPRDCVGGSFTIRREGRQERGEMGKSKPLRQGGASRCFLFLVPLGLGWGGELNSRAAGCVVLIQRTESRSNDRDSVLARQRSAPLAGARTEPSTLSRRG